MPFVGETGGVGWASGEARRPVDPARGPDARPIAPADRSGLPTDPRSPTAWPRRRRAPRRIATTTSRGPRGPTGCSDDRPHAARLRRWAARDRPGAGPDRPRLPRCSPSGSTSTSRGSSTATSGRPSSRPGSTWSSCGRRPRLREDAAALRARLGDEVAEPDRRTGWTPSSSPSRRRRAALAGERAAVRGARRALHRVRAAAPAATRVFDAARARDRGAAAGRRAAGRAAGGLGRRGWRSPVDRLPAVVDWLVARFRDRALGRLRPARRRGPARPTRHATSRGAATTGSTAAGARGSTSTRTCRSVPPTSSTRSPTRRTRATTSSTPGRRPTWSTGCGRLEA